MRSLTRLIDDGALRSNRSRKRITPPAYLKVFTVQPTIRLADAYELILGSSTDLQFGPVVLFGLGGQLVEVFRDRARIAAPEFKLARRMMERTKIYKAFAGVHRSRPMDRSRLEQILIRFSLLGDRYASRQGS